MTKAKPIYECRRWTVVVSDDQDSWDVLDHDGDIVDGAYEKADAIEACQAGALASYRERLWEAITETDVEDFPLHTLQSIADMLGHNALTL